MIFSSGQMFDHPNRVVFHEGSQPHFMNVHGSADTHVHSVATGEDLPFLWDIRADGHELKDISRLE
jgi:hypothetical protein